MAQKINWHNIILGVIGVSFFIGLWHALPMLNVINDEMYYVGGVLRAIQHHTIIPHADDVPYGTVTYLVSYGLMLGYLVLLLPFFKFSFIALTFKLVQSPEIAYIIPRIASGLSALVYLYFVRKLLLKEFKDKKIISYLLVLLFSTIIVVALLHTGKMWVLSTILPVISFYFLYTGDIGPSIILAFLAFANFPFDVYALINIPIFLWLYKHDSFSLKRILNYTIIGGLLFIALTLFNFTGIQHQIQSIFTSYRPIGKVASTKGAIVIAFFSYLKKIVLLYPLMLITLLIAVWQPIRNKKFFAISLTYLLTYFIMLSVVATWPSGDTAFLRFLFPFGTYFIFLIASFDLKFKKIFYAVGGLSAVYGLLTIYYLAVPTTYNNAYDYALKNLNSNGTVIVNDVAELQLPKNKISSQLMAENYCATKCQIIISKDLNQTIKFLVIDKLSKKDLDSKALENNKQIYSFKEKRDSLLEAKLVKAFVNPVGDDAYFSVDYNLGSYFKLSYPRLHNFGKNIYIYHEN